MLKFSYMLNDGLVIVHAAPKAHIEKMLGPLTDEQYRAHVLEKSIPEGATDVKEITAEDIPEDRHFRNAWEIQEGKIGHNLPKARKLHLHNVRRERNAKLEQLDREWMASQGNPKALKDIEAKKQKLRDAPAKIAQSVESCECVIALRDIVPDELK